MILGVYGDTHLTKNMKTLQYTWEVTATKSIHHMYNKFDELGVEIAVCLGDFFDAPRLEAKHFKFILSILEDINRRTYPTYILLGNHEADSSISNVLEYLSVYENIHPVTTTYQMENLCFIPYYEDPSQIDLKDRIVFTHHDIYGSDLAAGKTKAFFGIAPAVFKDAKIVLNGHVHLRSRVTENIVNAGSLLVSQQGELRLGDYPRYYTLDTNSNILSEFNNEHSMIYLTIDESEGSKLLSSGYDQSHLVLKVEYEKELPNTWMSTAQTTWRKKISSIDSEQDKVIRTINFDMKNYLVDYIKRDEEISDQDKDDYVKTGLELL